MNGTRLVTMANQIGAFFAALPDRDQAVRGIADHLRRFWEPRLRSGLLEHVAKAGDGELSPLVRAALPALARQGTPAGRTRRPPPT